MGETLSLSFNLKLIIMLIIISPQDRASQIATLEQQIDATEFRMLQCQEQYEYELLQDLLDAYITTHAILVTNCS